MSELIRLLSKDTGGSRHYTGWEKKNTIGNQSEKMLGLQSDSSGRWSRSSHACPLSGCHTGTERRTSP